MVFAAFDHLLYHGSGLGEQRKEKEEEEKEEVVKEREEGYPLLFCGSEPRRRRILV